jgi:hypothetical protein
VHLDVSHSLLNVLYAYSEPYLPGPRSYVTWLFWMLTAQKSLKWKNSEKNHIPGEVFSLYILLQDFPPTMMPFWLIPQKVPKNPKIQVIWDLGGGNPATLGRKNGSCHVTGPPSSDLAHAYLRNIVLCAGGRDRALDRATASPKLKCFI